MGEDLILKQWLFESGTLEGFTGVIDSSFSTGDIVVSLSPIAHSGAYALQLCGSTAAASFISGNAWALLGKVPIARKYRIEYWLREAQNYPGTPNSGVRVCDSDGKTLVSLTSNNNSYIADSFVTICEKQFDSWIRHVIEWERGTGVTTYAVYDVYNALLGSTQLTRTPAIGKSPAIVSCLFRSTYSVRPIQYDDITVSAFGALSRRRRRAAWMNLERPAVL